MLIIANILVIISSSIMMIQHLAALWTGRVLRGIITGIVSVTVPVFINEIAIKKFKTMQLGLLTFFIMLGFFFVCIFKLTIPNSDLGDNDIKEI